MDTSRNDDYHGTLIAARGSIHVTSDDFLEELNDKESQQYRAMEVKYSSMISATYQKSDLGDAFVETAISGFDSGSLVVGFQVIFDQSLTSDDTDTISVARSIFLEEIIDASGEFGDMKIDVGRATFEAVATANTTNKEEWETVKLCECYLRYFVPSTEHKSRQPSNVDRK